MKSILCPSMRTCLIVGLIALLVPNAFAHTYLSTVVLGGSQLSEGDCVRPHPASGFDSPISSITSSDMTCGFLPAAATAANRACPISAGSSIGIIWHHNSNSASDDIIDSSHKGPVIFYLAKSSTGSGNVWFKIYQDGYDASTGKWATDKLISNKGLVTFTIPSDISSGSYLLRGEVLALHQANVLNGVQPYVGCVELTISGSGSANPSGVAFPGAYSATDPGIYFNLYTTFTSYTIPGPALYVSGSSSASATSSSSSSSSTSSKSTSTSSSTSTSGVSTTAPTTKPSTTTGSSSTSTLKLQLNSGTNAWWFGVAVSGGSQTTTKVELKESGSSSWNALSNQGWAFVYSKSTELKLPISLRLTSSSSKKVTLTNVYTSWSNTALIDTGKDYSSKRSVDEVEGEIEVTETETEVQVEAAVEATPVLVTVFSTANPSWFAVQVTGVEEIASVELMDSAALSSYAFMTFHKWGYGLSAPEGTDFAAPLSVRVTNAAGISVTATIESFTPHLVAFADGAL